MCIRDRDKRKIDFYIYELEAQKIKISNDPISVSELTYNINAVIDNYQMKKLKATQITKWLEYNGYLQSDINEKTFHKICTEKAINIGIYRVKKINSYNETYYVNLYRDIAQKFIIKNINNISGAIIE